MFPEFRPFSSQAKSLPRRGLSISGCAKPYESISRALSTVDFGHNIHCIPGTFPQFCCGKVQLQHSAIAQVVLREAILSCITPDKSRLELLDAYVPWIKNDFVRDP